MIEIDLTKAILLYGSILVAAVAGIWLYTELAVTRTQRFLGKQFLWHCVFCGLSYLDEDDQPLSQCPRCGSINSIEDNHAKVSTTPSAWGDEGEAGDAAEESAQRKNPSHRKRPHQKSKGPRRRR